MLAKFLQLLGAAIFGFTVWKGVHGFWVSTGLITGAALAYLAKHFDLAAEIAKLKSYLPPYHHAALFLLCVFCGCVVSACSVKKHREARRYEVLVPRECLESVELTDRTVCHSGPDGATLHCAPLTLKKRAGCETLSAKK
ncbi:MAG TPA: hypothetical protein VGR55_01345 [Candidatus Acidoferrum sp.]|nr:hypothetical protein [Candidatus Acidoferrum sp.]